MKIVSICVVRVDLHDACILVMENDLSSFSFFQRGTIGEFLAFTAKTIAQRCEKGIRISVEENENIIHAFCNLSGLCAVIVTDKEYPARVAFGVNNRILEEFCATFSRDQWLTCTERLSFPKAREMLVKFQNPHEADPIMRVQRELDETKVVLYQTMEALLKRGENLDDLVAKSDELGSQSKMFFKQAKKQNSCCVIQ